MNFPASNSNDPNVVGHHPLNSRTRRATWTAEEDEMLKRLIEVHGPGSWYLLARHLPGRIGKQCRERYHNKLRNDLRIGGWTEEEDDLIFELHERFGNQWAFIARQIKGRSDNAIKNRYYAVMKRKEKETEDGQPCTSETAVGASGDAEDDEPSQPSPRPEKMRKLTADAGTGTSDGITSSDPSKPMNPSNFVSAPDSPAAPPARLELSAEAGGNVPSKATSDDSGKKRRVGPQAQRKAADPPPLPSMNMMGVASGPPGAAVGLFPYLVPGQERIFYAPVPGAEHMVRWGGPWGGAPGPMVAMPYNSRHPMAHPGIVMAPTAVYGQEYGGAAVAPAMNSDGGAAVQNNQAEKSGKSSEATEPDPESPAEEEEGKSSAGEKGEDVKEGTDNTEADGKPAGGTPAESTGAVAAQQVKQPFMAQMAMPAAYSQLMMPMYDQGAYTASAAGFKPHALPMHAAYYGMYGPPPGLPSGPPASW